MSTHLNRQKAGSRTRGAQALLGVLIVGGGAALAAGLRVGAKAELPPADGMKIPEADLAPKKEGGTAVAVDSSAIAARMDEIVNHPTLVPPAPPPGGEADPNKPNGNETPPPQPPPDEIKFLGAVMGFKPMALVSENGKQLFVTVGDPLGGGHVESITATNLKINGSVGKTLELASKSADVLTRGNKTPGGRPMTTTTVAGRGGNQPSLTVYKPPEPQGSQGLNGEPIPPVPDYILPELAGRYDELRQQLRDKKAVRSEAELAEYASKLLMNEDPKGVDRAVMEKQRAIEATQKGKP